MESNLLPDIGGGLTVVGLLSILINNFLVRRKDEQALLEKLSHLQGKIEQLDRHQSELQQVITANVHKLELLLHELHGETKIQRLERSAGASTCVKERN